MAIQMTILELQAEKIMELIENISAECCSIECEMENEKVRECIRKMLIDNKEIFSLEPSGLEPDI